MGRPINKKYLGNAAGRIKVSHTFDSFNGAETAGGDDTFIVSQRSTNRFLIRDESDDWSEVLTLVDKDAGSLAAGEFRISAQDEDGNEVNVARLYNRTLRVGEPGNLDKVAWSISAPADVTLTGITAADPAVVTVPDTSVFVDGETVTISGVVGTMSIINGAHVITIIDATTFSIPFDSTGLVRDSGGVISGVGGTGSIDIQAS